MDNVQSSGADESAHPAAPADIASARRRRYQVWAAQQQAQHELCFGTVRRYFCDGDCRWRSECMSLRAEWMR